MNIIIVSAHPDDEILGAGGTLLRHSREGDEIHWIIGTNMFEDQGYDNAAINRRQKEIDEVGARLGVEKIYKLDYPTATLSSSLLPELIPSLMEIFRNVEPRVVYSVNRSDAHSDHRVTADAVMACCKTFRVSSIEKVLFYECISETEFAPAVAERAFIPNYYVDISDFLEEKLEIMKIYESELGDHPFPRSLKNIEALATFRGATAGVEYAEAFQLIKEVVR